MEQFSFSGTNNKSKLFITSVLIAVVLAFISGCTIQLGGNQSLEQTQMALSVQQTVIAQQSSLNMQNALQEQQATLIAQSAQATVLAQQLAQPQQPAVPAADLFATQVAVAAQATVLAQQANSAQQQPAAPAQPAAQPAAPQPAQIAPQDVKSFMKTASVLLFEDMVADTRNIRYFKKTLDALGMNYVDTGSAKGTLKSQLLSGGPGGKGWDLIIIAAERRTSPTGEYFDYVNDALNRGSAVILEVWFIDRVASGTISTLLNRCGLQFERNYFGKNLMPIDYIVWPISGVDHPLLYQPNSGLSFTNVVDFWDYSDLGDLVKLSGRGDAKLILGTIATEKSTHGVLSTCMDDRFILQTFCSHDIAYDSMMPLIENYFYNALEARLRWLAANGT